MKRRYLAVLSGLAISASLLAAAPATAATPRAVLPSAPINVVASPGDVAGSILVDWDYPQTGDNIQLKGYKLAYHTLKSPDDWKYTEVQGPNPLTEKLVTGLTIGESYIFQVQTLGFEGDSEWSADSNGGQGVLPLANTPGVPGNLVAVSGDRTVSVSWSAPTPPPSGYLVQYRLNNDGAQWQPTSPTAITSTTLSFGDLTVGQTYFFRVASTNGGTAVSDYVATTTPVGPGAAPNPPQGVIATGGDRQVTLTWSAPSPQPARYQIQYKVSGSASWSVTDTTDRTTYTAGNLTNGTAYVFQVRSVRDDLFSSPVEVSATPSGSWTTPPNPVNVTAFAGNTVVYMSWTMPAGAQYTDFDVQYSTNNSSWFPTNGLRTGSSNLSYVLSGLTNGVPYYLRVRAVNGPQVSAGWTAMSGTVTPAGTPGAPTSVVGTPGNGQVLVSWNTPASTGVPVNGYLVQSSTNGGITWAAAATLNTPATSVLVSGLTNGVSYTFRVAATSGVGTGSWSIPSAPVTPPGGPGIPTNVFGAPGNGQVSVGWTPPTGVQTSPITGYRVTASPGGQSCFTSATPPAVPPATCTVTGLTNGQPYTFTVVTISAVGVSAPSAPSTPVTPIGGPNPPTGVTAVAGDRSATVSWTPPVSAAGGPITSYRATSSPDGRACTVSAPATSCTVTGLTNGRSYTFTVVAISSVGTSVSSAASAPVTPFTSEVTLRITDSSRDGRKVIIKGTTQGVDPGDTLDVLIRNSGKGQFTPAGEVVVRANGTFRWTTTNVNRTWLRVTDGDVVSNTVIVPAR